MSRLRNLPDGIRLMHTIIHFNFYSRGIEKARAEGDAVKEREEIASSTLIWAKDVAEKFRMDIRVTGRENIPERCSSPRKAARLDSLPRTHWRRFLTSANGSG